MVRKILQVGDPILSQVCEQVKDIKDAKTQQVIKDLIDTAESQRKITAGLAAPQIGETLAICICRRVDLEEESKNELPPELLWEVMINPEIIEESKGQSVFWEACLSVGTGKKQLFGPVNRPESIKVQYLNQKGEQKELYADDYFSHEIQHELDHLNGILFLKYVSNPSNIWLLKDIDEYIQKNGTYPPIN
jgi:peptide deformylase